jgi:hypothetical protein
MMEDPARRVVQILRANGSGDGQARRPCPAPQFPLIEQPDNGQAISNQTVQPSRPSPLIPQSLASLLTMKRPRPCWPSVQAGLIHGPP